MTAKSLARAPRPSLRTKSALEEYSAIKLEGTLLTRETVARVAARDGALPGLRDADFGLMPGKRLGEQVAQVWGDLKRAWGIYQLKLSEYRPDDPNVLKISRKLWLLPLLKSLGFEGLEENAADEIIRERPWRLSHRTSSGPALHLVSPAQDLDARDPVRTPAGRKQSPHSYVQSYLNCSDKYLWAVLSNGSRLRLLRDSAALSLRAAYVEFDLEKIFDNDAFGDFMLLWLMCHATRFAPPAGAANPEPLPAPDATAEDGEEAAAPEADAAPETILELWHKSSFTAGARALEELAADVRIAINALGQGFLRERANLALKKRIASGELSKQDYYRQLLRIVYRIVFVLIAEERGLFHDPKTPANIRELYKRCFSVSRIRALTRRTRGGRCVDLWEQLRRTLEWCYNGRPELGIPHFGSALFDPRTTPDITGDPSSDDPARRTPLKLGNTALLSAIRSLTHTSRNGVLQQVDYRALGSEELGSVYESLLEMRVTGARDCEFSLEVFAGNDRKTSGSFYTPHELVASLLDTALDPVIDDVLARLKEENNNRVPSADKQIKALLGLKICDPACGSGHFLVGAARRLGRKIAQIKTGDDEPAPNAVREGVREACTHCLYGVDLNPMTVELCKVSLWIEMMNEGKDLSFIDHRIKCGNSLLGAGLEQIAEGVPNEAFEPLVGDDKKVCARVKKTNSQEREDRDKRQGNMLWSDSLQFTEALKRMHEKWSDVVNQFGLFDYDTCLRHYNDLRREETYIHYKDCLDLWCAAFLLPKLEIDGFHVTQNVFTKALVAGVGLASLPKKHQTEVAELVRLIEENKVFHWMMEFPDVFPPHLDCKGFDVVLGNPPWERVKLQEKEWFAERVPEIAGAKNKAARQRMIEALDLSPETARIANEFRAAKRRAETASAFIRNSGRFPLCGRGDVNTYSVFAELNRRLASRRGRVGCIVPSGIATDDTTKEFFQDLVRTGLDSLYDFENRRGLFPAVDSRMKFSLLTLAGPASGRRRVGGAVFSFFNLRAEDLKELAVEKEFTLSQGEIDLLNPNTGTCPVFRSVKDAELTKALYRRVPVLIREERPGRKESNPWGIRFCSMFHMANDSHLFRDANSLAEAGFVPEGALFRRPADGAEFWPLYEAKMIHHYNSRFGDYRDLPEGSKSTQLPDVPLQRLRDPEYQVWPRYWVEKGEVLKRIPEGFRYLIGWRDFTNVGNRRTIISAITQVAPVGHTLPLFFSSEKNVNCLYSCMCSFIADYAARQKVCGLHLTQHLLKQMPFFKPNHYDLSSPFTFSISKQAPNSQTYADFILPRVLELTYTSWSLQGFAKSVGYEGEPFIWDEERRFLLKCELDALFFGLYFGFGDWREATEAPESPEDLQRLRGFFPTPGDAIDHVMESFPIVKRKELADLEFCKFAQRHMKAHGDYLYERFPSHAVIRRMYEEMCEAARSGGEWRSWVE